MSLVELHIIGMTYWSKLELQK